MTEANESYLVPIPFLFRTHIIKTHHYRIWLCHSRCHSLICLIVRWAVEVASEESSIHARKSSLKIENAQDQLRTFFSRFCALIIQIVAYNND